jgi:hypothetical protein
LADRGFRKHENHGFVYTGIELLQDESANDDNGDYYLR